MNTREQKVTELMENFQSLRRTMVFRPSGLDKMPRITPSQWGVLMMIEASRESTVKDVAETLCITSSAATQLVDGLVVSGYLVRTTSAEDRRSIKLTLSKQTKTQVDKMKKQGIQKFLTLFEVLSNKEFDQYISLNKKIVERLLKHNQKTFIK